jgi:hypothetical protein
MKALPTRLICAAFAIFVLSNCGSSNVNQIFVSKDQSEALDVLLFNAQYQYDKGEFKKAQEFADKAHKISPNNEDVGIILGYINLALGGIDTFNLAIGLIEAGKAKTDSKLTAAKSKNAVQTLGSLGAILEMSEEDVQKLGTLTSAEDKELFEDYDLIYPDSVVDVHKNTEVNTAKYMNKAISFICPFVDDEVKIEEDDRTSKDNCAPTENSRYNQTKSHFIWAFANLAEALMYYAVVFYQQEDAKKSNFEMRVDTLEENKDDIGIASYISYITQLTEDVDSVFQFDDSESQLRGILNGLTATSKAFSRMAGLPESVTKGINKGIDSINEKSKAASGASTEDKQASVLKSQFTDTLSKQLSAQITANAATASTAEIEEMCDAYENIGGGVGTKPETCP